MTFLEGHLQSHLRIDRDYRSCKLYAATILLSAINTEPIRIKAMPSTLALVAGLVYQINGLHSRPQDDSAGRTIQRTVYPLTQNMEHPNILVPNTDLSTVLDKYPDGFPYALAGSHFITDIWIKPQSERFKFRDGRSIPADMFQHVFGCTIEEVARKLFQSGTYHRRVRQGYVPQRKGYTKTRRIQADGEDIPAHFEQFAEMEVPIEVDDAGPEDITMVGASLDKIWQQYASDILQKVGNPRNRNLAAASYSHLPQYNRQQLSINDINTLDLDHLFAQIQWRRASEKEWEKSFNILFPARGYQPGPSMKHLTSCTYYNNYLTLIQQLSEEDALEIRSALSTKSRTLAWVPAAMSDRCWDYRSNDKSFNAIPRKDEGGPRIYINPWIGGQPNLTDHFEEDRLALQEEEEENSEEEAAGNAAPAGVQVGTAGAANEDGSDDGLGDDFYV
jgi:hypothetical protein